MQKIHFIGLGNMGLPMAVNCQKAGYNISVFDINDASLNSAKGEGLTPLSLENIGKGADIVITMLPTGDHAKQVIIGGDVAAKMNGQGVIIDCTTADKESCLKIANYANGKNISFIDAPVSGGINGAKLGSLTFMIGGDEGVVKKLHPLFNAMGKNIFHAGENGAGQVAKACNNMMLAISMAGVCEALTLGANNGLDVGKLSDIMKNASGGNWVLNVYNPWPGVMEAVPASNDYQGGFKSNLMLKDLHLAGALAKNTQSCIPLGKMVTEFYDKHCHQDNMGDHDFSSLIRRYQDSKK